MFKKIGLTLFTIAIAIFTLSLTLSQYRLTESVIEEVVSKQYHWEAIFQAARDMDMINERYTSNFEFVPALKKVLKAAQQLQEKAAQIENGQATGIPEGVREWDFRMGDGDIQNYLLYLTKHSGKGLMVQHHWWFFMLSIGLGTIGGLLYMAPHFFVLPGIKNNNIYHRSLSRGVAWGWRTFFIAGTILGVGAAGYFKSINLLLWTVGIAAAILLANWWKERKNEETTAKVRDASPKKTGWLGLILGLYFIGFYVLLYWEPAYITNWMIMMDPLSYALSGNEAGQWFLYGFLYTIVILVMGVRMFGRYRHNRYQLIRTGSVMFFQLAFAFLIPEILVRLNQPYYDFKNIWPLDYDFFFDWHLNSLLSSGGLGIFMLFWGIALIVIGVPVLSYFYGKRWYCSWVCGCGGLAETFGDPFRQLSDKSLRAWRIERYLIHSVLVFSVIMTVLVLYSYFTGASEVLGFNSYQVRSWYGFLIGAAFAGVVGVGFYPLMGNRVWCRFGCPLAAYLGLVQRFKSRFRITTNGGQCISCGNCSTYCEMGIDVRWYAQRGQDIVRSSCVGCGICSAVCPRGVLRLENASEDINERATELRVIHISKEGISLPM